MTSLPYTILTAAKPSLLSLQVGQPKKLDFHGKVWESAIYKAPVVTRVRLERGNLAGDRQYNLKYHGGPDKAVCCFSAEHYPYWRDDFGLGETFTYGAFGENFTLSGLLETEACIGDVYIVGSAQIQVSQPRQPCINVARKWDRKEMPRRMEELGQTGYYLRVLVPGEVGSGDTLILQDRPHPDVTIHRLNRAMYQDESTPEQDRQLASLPELAASGRRIFQRRLQKLSSL